jgi:tripeptidyl-peptidase-1
MTNFLGDPVYPNPAASGYKGPQALGFSLQLHLLAFSWAGNEGNLPAAYMNRQCNG